MTTHPDATAPRPAARRTPGPIASPAPLRLEAAAARRLALSLAGLADPPGRKLTGDGLLALVERLGFVQVDSIQTVARAHQMILFARNETYRPEQLRRLLEDERRLFEHWTDRIAAIIPTRFYPWWTWRFRRDAARLAERFTRWFGADYQAEIDRLLERIRADGPLMARDLAAPGGRPAGGWWEWHAGKAALEFLWRGGQLAVARRQGFQKVYDLPERVIPGACGEPAATHDDFVDWACRSALERLGIASPGEIARFWGLLTPAEAASWAQANLGKAAVPALVEGADGSARRLVARPDLPDLLPSLSAPPPRLRALNPFDPLLRDRDRLARLFGFDYRIEVFVPAPQRRWGYYIFPLLEGERLVGRLDMKAVRSEGALEVTALWLEPGVRASRGRLRRLEAELERVRRFAGLETVRFADGFYKEPG
jgi:uncharacterized protein YcaQ